MGMSKLQSSQIKRLSKLPFANHEFYITAKTMILSGDLGKLVDRDVAIKYGCSASFVKKVRQGVGIDCATYHKPKCTIDELNISFKNSGWRALAVQLLKEGKLGKVPDKELAKAHNCSRPFIEKVRRAAKIRVYRAPKTSYDYIVKTGALGEFPDNKLAREFHVSSEVIRKLREERNIPPFNRLHKQRKDYVNPWYTRVNTLLKDWRYEWQSESLAYRRAVRIWSMESPRTQQHDKRRPQVSHHSGG